MAPTAFDPKAVNIWTARVIPVILIGIVGYVTWVVIVLVCADYLLEAHGTSNPRRPSTGIAIIVVYSFLLLLLAFSYLRLFYTVTSNPGFVPRGPQWHANQTPKQRPHSRNTRNMTGLELEKTNGPHTPATGSDGYALAAGPPTSEAAVGQETSNLHKMYTKEVFSCEGDGRPIWCSTCLNFKPDRAHHCREVGRCVRKMDHFCPWVGGVISETSFKFFLQFTTWASFYCIFNLIVMAIFVAELKRQTNTMNVHWVITLAFGGLFGLFTLGMSFSSMQFVLLNTTTIENLSRHSKVWTLAVLIPKNSLHSIPPPFHTITYPLGYVGPNQDEARPEIPAVQLRKFAILHSKPGENPWDLGPFRNFKSVMGDRWYDWFLPIRYSPCTHHDRYEAQFETGPVVQRMREDAGLAAGLAPFNGSLDGDGKPERKRRRRRRQSTQDDAREDSDRRRRKRRHSHNLHSDGGNGTELSEHGEHGFVA